MGLGRGGANKAGQASKVNRGPGSGGGRRWGRAAATIQRQDRGQTPRTELRPWTSFPERLLSPAATPDQLPGTPRVGPTSGGRPRLAPGG